jgi:zinc and cadmium transporter
MPIVLLAYYCVFILAASIAGGMIPVWFQLTHRGMQFAVSFVAGVMLGVGVLHMLPHALVDAAAAQAAATGSATLPMSAIWWTMFWLLAGMLTMFFIERFFCFHHHDVPQPGVQDDTAHDCEGLHSDHHDHVHDLSWTGTALGLTLHTVLNGVALAAAVEHGSHGAGLAGFGTFLVIFLHKPFDAMTIGTLMARGGRSTFWRHAVNALFSLAIPAGALLFYFGLASDTSMSSTSAPPAAIVAYALAFSAGTFLCISLSDLLPELQFHQHDRVKLSAALLLGLGVAFAAGHFESASHSHDRQAPVVQNNLRAAD